MRLKTTEDKYRPLGNNCQHLWTNGLLEAIVCQCPNQPRLRIPWSVDKRVAGARAGAATAHRVADFIIAFAKLQYLGMPWVQPWTTWSNRWVHLFMEVSKYYDLWVTLTERNVKVLSFRDPDLRWNDAIEQAIDNQTLRGWRGKVTRQLRSLQVLQVILCLLDTVFGSLYRFHEPWGVFWWADIALGIVALITTHHLEEEHKIVENRPVGCKARFVVGFGKGQAS